MPDAKSGSAAGNGTAEAVGALTGVLKRKPVGLLQLQASFKTFTKNVLVPAKNAAAGIWNETSVP